MARPLRIKFPGAFYHVTSRGIEKRALYYDRTDRFKFLSYLESAGERYGAVIHTYCLMGNHYHLLLETPRGNLSQIMRHINGAYSAYTNRKRERVGHFFQGRYRAILVDADSYLLELSRYIHLNPVRAGLTEKPTGYPWSSFGAYGGLRPTPPWLDLSFVLSYFKGNQEKRKRDYRIFVEAMNRYDLPDPSIDVTASAVLGREEFIRKVKEEHLRNRGEDDSLPSLKRMRDRPSMEKITHVVNALCGKETKEAKRATIYFCHRFSGERLQDIGLQFNIKAAAVCRASQRFSQRLRLEPTLKKLAQEIEAGLKM